MSAPAAVGTALLVVSSAHKESATAKGSWSARRGVARWDMPSTLAPRPAWDVSGVVAEVGFGVTTLKVGDEVYGMPWFPRAVGGYAEYVTAPARQFARKPATISHEQAAAVPLAALTAWQALADTADVQPGQRVLIHAAAGGVGHSAVCAEKDIAPYFCMRSALRRLCGEFFRAPGTLLTFC